MPKTAVQTPICDICGADVRDGSLFCYNCGGSLKHDAQEITQEPVAVISAPTNGSTKGAGASQPEVPRRKRADRGPVQVVWAPREGVSIIYVAAGTGLLIIALILFLMAMFLK